MSTISTSASAISAGFARFDDASARLLGAVSGGSDTDAAKAVADQMEAKITVEANVSTVRISDEMFKALLEIQRQG